MDSALKALIEKTKVEHARQQGVVSSLLARKQTLSAAKLSHAKEVEIAQKAGDIIRIVADDRRTCMKERVEKLLSYGLTAAFNEPMKAELTYQAWGMSDRISITITDRNVTTQIEDSRGGGVVNIVSFLLELLILHTFSPAQRKLLLLDEPFSMVSEGNVEAVGSLVSELAHKMGIQIVLITHSTALAESGDKVYRISKRDGKTEVRLVS